MDDLKTIGSLDFTTFAEMIDNLYDEIVIYDNKYNLVYINKACKRHYGVRQEDLIGYNFFDLEAKYWNYSILPAIYKSREAMCVKQRTYTGAELITIAVPWFDDKNELKYVLMSVRDNVDNFSKLKLEDADRRPTRVSEKSTLIYESELMQKVIALVEKIANIDSPCLLLGESGTGKSLIAKHMHGISERRKKPFIHINCASIQKDLVESELFGYAKGAFTGAQVEGRIGLVEAANSGTLFLDEIADLPYPLQSRLLHVIQDREFIPVGSTKSVKVDIKIIAATNRDLKKMANAGAFREDLLYRLNVFDIVIPPLRERPQDIFSQIFYFLNLYDNKYQKEHEIAEETLQILCSHVWKGNTRELSHLMERLVVTVDEMMIRQHHLPSHIFEISPAFTSLPMEYSSWEEAKQQFEKIIVRKIYRTHSSTRAMAKHLKISQSKASRLIRKYVETSSKDDPDESVLSR